MLEAGILARSVKSVSLASSLDWQVLRCWLAFNVCDRSLFLTSLHHLRLKDPSRLETRILSIVGWLWFDDFQAINTCPSAMWRSEDDSLLLQLCKIAFLIKKKNWEEVDAYFSRLKQPDSLEALMLRAQYLSAQGKHQEAVDRLLPALERAPMNIRLYRQILDHLMDARNGQYILEIAKTALSRFGEHPELLYHMTCLNLLQRHPGLSRRSAMLQQVWSSSRSTRINIGNQVTTYEMNGGADWLEFLLSSVCDRSVQEEALFNSNLCLQLASIQSSHYQDHLKGLVGKLMSTSGYTQFAQAGSGVPKVFPTHGRKLRVGWMTGDLAYHPVSRFLYGNFFNSTEFMHEHILLNLVDHGVESIKSAFNQLRKIDILDVSCFSDQNRVSEIRNNQFDVLIDLSGWTGGNFMSGLLAKLAPIQVNYLGYFASSGLPTMDYWLGDNHLFPAGHCEWATESLWRLSRPFLAWQPAAPLPEASIDIPDPVTGPVRFGSFNHNRKLSDSTLRLWGQLLEDVPDSRLVLKASAQNDSDTQRLLRRRMLRQGLDPERVEWLALTSGPVEHMQQYAQIDIALDPIPNGGCTTTCEALWMGVPTITLEGSHYVSRMSTAVLAGADMPEWIAKDRAGYIALARSNASRVAELRTNRDHWRLQLQNSPLGDAADLMRHLEDAFSHMYAEALSKT